MGSKNFLQNHVMLFTEKDLKLTTFDQSRILAKFVCLQLHNLWKNPCEQPAIFHLLNPEFLRLR